MEQQPSFRFKATYQGEVLGWYDTLDEAIDAIEQAARDKQDAEERSQYWAKQD